MGVWKLDRGTGFDHALAFSRPTLILSVLNNLIFEVDASQYAQTHECDHRYA
jgi:hypothetical protein